MQVPVQFQFIAAFAVDVKELPQRALALAVVDGQRADVVVRQFREMTSASRGTVGSWVRRRVMGMEAKSRKVEGRKVAG